MLHLLFFIFFVTADENVTSDPPVINHEEAPDDMDTRFCGELRIGASRTIDYPSLDKSVSDPTYTKDLRQKFVITRKSQKEFNVRVPIIFNKNIDHDDPGMRKHVIECLKVTNPYFRDKDGNHFTIEVDENARQAKSYGLTPFTHSVHTSCRNDSENFSQDIPCSTVAHEMFHLLGFVDEYSLKDSPRFNCRSIQDRDFLMGNYRRRLDFVRLKQAVCKCTERSCSEPHKKSISAYEPFECARGYELYSKNEVDSSFNDKNSYTIKQELFMDPGGAVLAPAYTRHLLHPGCKAKNEKYYTCAANAYKTAAKGSCPRTPDYCKDGTWLD